MSGPLMIELSHFTPSDLKFWLLPSLEVPANKVSTPPPGLET